MTAEDDRARGDLTRKAAGRALSATIVAAAIVVGLYVARLYYVYPRTDDAYVRANLVGIAPHVSGPIVSLPIVDNQHVHKGNMLFVVDPRPYQTALERATARLQLTNLEIKAYEQAISAASAEQTRRAADLAYDRQYLKRIEPLLARHFVTANDVFDARSKVHAAQAAVDNARSEVHKAENQLGQLGDINARRKEAEAQLYDARLNVGYCYVRAPFDGYVTNLNIAVGQYANILSRGGWPMVPPTDRLRLGNRHPSVAPLRRRLIVVGFPLPAPATPGTPMPTSRWPGNCWAMNPRSDSKRACAAPWNGAAKNFPGAPLPDEGFPETEGPDRHRSDMHNHRSDLPPYPDPLTEVM